MAEGFQISHFYRLFSSDVMAVKGLSCSQLIYTGAPTTWKYRNDLGRQRRRDKKCPFNGRVSELRSFVIVEVAVLVS